MLRTKEHIELMAQFERDCTLHIGRVDKEAKDLWARGIIYQDGKTNELFLLYRKGYAFGRFVERQEA
jgi:hypothetical protein